jgi:hypothetical protein
MTAPDLVSPAFHYDINKEENKDNDNQGCDTAFVNHSTLFMILNL